MALFHLSVTQTKRSAGQSAIASAAYRAGERLYSAYYGEYSDYTGSIVSIIWSADTMTFTEYRCQILHLMYADTPIARIWQNRE